MNPIATIDQHLTDAARAARLALEDAARQVDAYRWALLSRTVKLDTVRKTSRVAPDFNQVVIHRLEIMPPTLPGHGGRVVFEIVDHGTADAVGDVLVFFASDARAVALEWIARHHGAQPVWINVVRELAGDAW